MNDNKELLKSIRELTKALKENTKELREFNAPDFIEEDGTIDDLNRWLEFEKIRNGVNTNDGLKVKTMPTNIKIPECFLRKFDPNKYESVKPNPNKYDL